MLDGDLAIRVGGQDLSGWQSVRLTRSCEQVPNSFQIGFTSSRSLDQLPEEGSPCEVFIGGDLALTGFVDVVSIDADANSHQLTLAGRGKCADLVDCTSEWPTSVINNETAWGVASKLCAPYGINVPPPPGETVRLPSFGVTLIETPWTLIEEIARYAQLLVYEDEGGSLILAGIGEDTAAGGLIWGSNVKAARVVRNASERFSEYVCYVNSTTDQLAEFGADANVRASDQDGGVKRHRRLGMTLEAPTGAPQQDFATRRIAWERARRAGRGRQAFVTVAGWRDAAGTLWTPNTRCYLYLPRHGVDGQTWVIGDVEHIRDEAGTRTELMLMPQPAFAPQPTLLADPLADILSEGAPGQLAPAATPSPPATT